MNKQKFQGQKIMMYRLSVLVLSLMLTNSGTALAQTSSRCVFTIEPFNFTANCFGGVPIAWDVDAQREVRGVIHVDMAGFACLSMEVEVRQPQGWVLNFGNSPTNDGFAGDGGTLEHNSEFEVLVPICTPGPPGAPMCLPGFQTPGALNVYTNDLGGSAPIFRVPNFHPGGAWLWTWLFEVRHHHLCIERSRGSLGRGPLSRFIPPWIGLLWDPFIFDVDSNSLDTESTTGFNDTLYHIGFNQVVDPTLHPERVGTGVRKITILFHTHEEDCTCGQVLQ